MKNKKRIIILISSIVLVIALCIIVAIILLNDNEEPKVIEETYTLNEYAENDIFRSYEDYNNYINSITEFRIVGDEIKEADFKDENVAVSFITLTGCSEELVDYTTVVEDSTFKFNMDIEMSCGLCAPEYVLLVKKIDKDITKVENYYKYLIVEECDKDMVYKPMIYIYPEKELDLIIKLGNSNLLTSTYPKYNDEWNVHVDTDGNIYDYDTNRNYYGLYWEAIDNTKVDMTEGYVVKGSETISLLEEKLEYLGLNEREINEFIVYWINKIENNNYNFINFRTTEEVNEYMPLELSENPDTLIRVLVDIVPLEEPFEVKPQELEKVERQGYTVVEWGARYLK